MRVTASNPDSTRTSTPANLDRLDSWKEIAAYLKRGSRTVQRWEREANLPIHRLQHEKLGSVYAYRSELDAWWNSRGTDLEADTPTAAARSSIAVLPFADMSQQQDQAYFCEGIADEIINTLSRIAALRVSSRTSSFQFKAGVTDLREIARRLRVDTLLEGSVRKSGSRLRISVQLAKAETGFHLWSDRYDRELSDVFAIQDEIAQRVVEALEVTLAPHERDSLQTTHTRNLQAYDAYLRARNFYYQFGPLDMDCAVQLFSRAIELDPEYAQAYAGLADCWSYIYLYSDRSEIVREQAGWASEKAVQMDPRSAAAQASRGFSLSIAGRDPEAEAAFETAIQLDSQLFDAYYFYARHCFVRGQAQKALQLYQTATVVQPEDYQARLLMAQIYQDMGRQDDATRSRRRGIENAEEHLKLKPDDARAWYMAANGLAALGESERARQYVERAILLRPDDSMLLYNAGCIYSLLGQVEDAVDCLMKAAAKGLTQRGWYEHDSNLDPLRSHPRFQQLLTTLP